MPTSDSYQVPLGSPETIGFLFSFKLFLGGRVSQCSDLPPSLSTQANLELPGVERLQSCATTQIYAVWGSDPGNPES